MTWRSFAAYHTAPKEDQPEESGISWSTIWTAIGIALCVGLFLYLAWMARKAVDEELQEEEGGEIGEERVGFLQDMSETPFRSSETIGIGLLQSAEASKG